RAQRIAAEAAEMSSGDFVLQVARELPLQAIAGLLGVPQEDREKLFDWSNQMIGDEDPEFADYDSLTSAAELMWYGMQLAARKAEDPGDDIVSTLVDADADGQLTEAEFGMFVVTLTIAGNETTRQSITQGMMAFTEFPEQWELFKAQRPQTAADEIIRWATPINAFQRTALVDTELSGVPIKKGQRLVLFYRSANFDEDVFDEPFSF
ncbi:steroid C27-monooxygenase, partial [Mycobacterium sp. ITM-2017-0098]